MSLDKIENTEVNNNSVEGLVPGDRMSGTSLQNKRIFDQLVRDVVVPKFNALIDALTETTGADEIGVNDEELHVQAETVQEALDAAKAAVGHKHAAGDIETGTLPVSRGGTGRTSFTDGSYLVGGATGGIALKSKVGVKDDLGINDKMDKANPLGAGNLSMSGKITAGADGTADNDLLRKAQIVALLAALTAADISADDTEMSKLSGGTVQAILESVDVALWSLTAADIEANNGVTEEPLQDLLDTILAALAAAATSAQLTAFEQALADDGVDSGTPGASLIGAVSLDGETGSTVAAVLDAIKTALAGKASSAALADDGIISGTPGAGMIGTTDLMGESSTVEAELQSHRNELDSLETYKMSKANPSGTGNLTMTGKVTAGAAATADNDLMRKGEVDTALDAKLNAASPSFTGGITGTGALSVNRLSGSTVGDYSAALGESTVAQSRGSVAVGRFTYATTAGQFTCGVYSKGDTNQVFIVGWGNGEGSRKNVFTVSKGGTGVFSYDCLIGTRSLKAVPVVFRVVGFDTYTLFCAAGTTWADVISGAENPEVTIVDTSEGGDPVPWHGRLLSAVGTSVKGKSSFMEAIQTWDLYDGNDIETANAVLTTDAPQDGATYYILTD